MEQFQTPILYLIFNRPGVTRITFQRIRELKPARLFIAADGPRKSHPDDVEKCKAAREAVFSFIDWECEVQTLLRDNNLGCGLAVSQAITWFFEHVEEGIILEDDCLPDPSFFTFCEELLASYRSEVGVMHISGTNYPISKKYYHESFYFSNYCHVWGWATWKRAWEHFDYNIYNRKEFVAKLLSTLKSPSQVKYWLNMAKTLDKGLIDTWDYRWQLSLLFHHGTSITPHYNLVQNLGFDNEATHTTNIRQSFPPQTIIHSLTYPLDIKVNHKLDTKTYYKYYSSRTSLINYIRNFMYKVVPASLYTKAKHFFYMVLKQRNLC